MFQKLFFISIAILFLCACNNRKDRVQVPFTAFIDVPAGLNTFYTYHFPVRVGTNGIVPIGMIDAQPSRMRMSLVSGEPNFDFVRRAYLDAVFNDSTWVEMGYNLEVFLNSSVTLDLLPSSVNLVDHISQDSFDVKIKLEFRGIPSATSQIRIDFSLEALIER